MLFIEYDVDEEGLIEVVAVVDAYEEDDLDPGATEWIAWRNSFEDGGHGFVAVPQDLEEAIEADHDPGELLDRIEKLIVTDRIAKEATSD